MSPLFVSSVIGLALLTVGLSQVSPSVIEAIHARKVEANVSREEALMQQIIRYRAIEGAFPAAMTDLITKGYWKAADNTNGFGGTYSFAIDANKGLISITTAIADATKRALYIGNYRHVFKPVDAGGGNVTTTFIMPSTGALAAPFPPTGAIPVSAVAPSAVTNTYWYDTSGSTAKLMVSDGASWSALDNGVSAPNSSNIVTGVTSLPATGEDGDIRYVYSAVGGGVLNTYVYYNGQWVLAGGGSAAAANTCANGATYGLDSGACVSSNLVTADSACSTTDGTLARDSNGEIYACTDLAVLGGSPEGSSCGIDNRVTYDVNANSYKCLN